VDYLLGVNPTDADHNFLKRVEEVAPNMYILFYTIFKTKTAFEFHTGHKYTSYLYFYPKGFQPSLTMRMYSHTSFTPDLNITESSSVLSNENNWMKMVRSIWEGYCSVPLTAGSSSIVHHVGGEVDEVAPGSLPDSQDSSSNGDPSNSQGEDEGEKLTPDQTCPSSEVTSTYPKAPGRTGCYLLINEYLSPTSTEPQSFIEHMKTCERKPRAETSTLSGYVEIVLRGGDVIEQIMFADFNGYELNTVVEESLPGMRKKFMQFFILGSNEYLPDMPLESIQTAHEYNGLPDGKHRVICVILLYIPKYSRNPSKKLVRSLQLNKLGENYVSTPLTENRLNIIKNHLQDVLIIGPPCTDDECGLFFELLGKRPVITSEHGLLVPHLDDYYDSVSKKYISINRCARNSLPMQQETFEPALPSPKQKNNCPLRRVYPLHNLQGVPLQRTAQRLVMN